MENYREALMLLIIGMGTVFIILTLIIILGKLIIRFVNKFLPEEIKSSTQIGQAIIKPQQAIDNLKLAAIVSAVEITTKGKGHITKIEKQ